MFRHDTTYTKVVYAHKNLEARLGAFDIVSVRTKRPIAAGTILTIEHAFVGDSTSIQSAIKYNKGLFDALSPPDSVVGTETVHQAAMKACFAADAGTASEKMVMTVSTAGIETTTTAGESNATAGIQTLSFDNPEIEDATFVVVFATRDLVTNEKVILRYADPATAVPYFRASKEKIRDRLCKYTPTADFVERHIIHTWARKGMYMEDEWKITSEFLRYLTSQEKPTDLPAVATFVREVSTSLSDKIRDEVDPLWFARRVLSGARGDVEVVGLGI